MMCVEIALFALYKGTTVKWPSMEVHMSVLTPPPSLPASRAPHLGREQVCKESKKNFKATVAMSQDFPLGIES